MLVSVIVSGRRFPPHFTVRFVREHPLASTEVMCSLEIRADLQLLGKFLPVLVASVGDHPKEPSCPDLADHRHGPGSNARSTIAWTQLSGSVLAGIHRCVCTCVPDTCTGTKANAMVHTIRARWVLGIIPTKATNTGRNLPRSWRSALDSRERITSVANKVAFTQGLELWPAGDCVVAPIHLTAAVATVGATFTTVVMWRGGIVRK